MGSLRSPESFQTFNVNGIAKLACGGSTVVGQRADAGSTYRGLSAYVLVKGHTQASGEAKTCFGGCDTYRLLSDRKNRSKHQRLSRARIRE